MKEVLTVNRYEKIVMGNCVLGMMAIKSHHDSRSNQYASALTRFQI